MTNLDAPVVFPGDLDDDEDPLATAPTTMPDDDVIDAVGDELRLWTRFDLTPEQIKTFLGQEGDQFTHLRRQLNYFGVDTEVRSDLLEVMAQTFTGRGWPMICERGQYDEDAFWQTMHQKAREAGWKVMDDDEAEAAKNKLLGR